MLTTRASFSSFCLFGREVELDAERLRYSAKFLLDYLAHQLVNILHYILKYLPSGHFCCDMEMKKDSSLGDCRLDCRSRDSKAH